MGRLTNAEVDFLVQSMWEEAVANGEPWALGEEVGDE